MRKPIPIHRTLKSGKKIAYATPDKGASGRTPKSKRWHKPSEIHSGWSKHDPADVRRKNTLNAHGGNLLASARAKMSLANVTADPITKRLAGADAKWFYDQYRRSKK